MHSKYNNIGVMVVMTTIVLSLSISSCTTTKHITTTTDATTSMLSTKVKSVTAKVKMTASAEGESMATNGTLRMKYNEAIQISLVDPLLGAVELGRMEFTPEKALIIDRVNKQYINVPYSEIEALRRSNVDFYTLQSIMWNEPMATLTDIPSFKVKYSDHKAFQGVKFPYGISMTLQSGTHEATLAFTLNSLKADNRWEATTVPSKYKKADPQKIFKLIVK